MAGVVGTSAGTFSFDAPVLTVNTPTNGPTCLGSSLTLLGANFGALDVTASAALYGALYATCTTLAWSANTRLMCATGTSAGSGLSMLVTVAASIGTLPLTYTFDSPSATLLRFSNLPTCSSATLSIAGLNFGSSDFTSSALVGIRSCTTTAWTSSTAVSCALPIAGTAESQSVIGVVAALAGTNYVGFSFDSPVASSMLPTNAAASGGTQVSISGLNFASVDATGTSKIHADACLTTSWTTRTSVSCYGTGPKGAGISRRLDVTIGQLLATLQTVFTFDAPVVSDSQLSNGPTSGSAPVTLSGLDFATNDLTPSAAIFLLSCRYTFFLKNNCSIIIFGYR